MNMQKLAYPAKEGFHRCWVNEEQGRIEAHLEEGYLHVYDGREKIKRIVNAPSGEGPLFAYLLECSNEHYLRKIGVLGPPMTSLAPPYVERGIKEGRFYGFVNQCRVPDWMLARSSYEKTGKECFDDMVLYNECKDDEISEKWSPLRLVCHVRPGQSFIGIFNWHYQNAEESAWFRLIFMPVRNWHLYMRVCWRPRVKIQIEQERRHAAQSPTH